MIKVSVFYPATMGAKFDTQYYFSKHLPMVALKLGSAMKSMSIESGLSGPMPGSAPAYRMLAHFTFESTDAFYAAFGPHADEITRDIANYTSIEPLIQLSEVKFAR